MSKYTTEIRFLCESLTGHTESVGYNGIKNVLNDAAPIIFDFDFPIFDEQYRLPLEIKILRHYYTREISEETYGLWKLKLEDRMNVIMPYYNKLYESELLKFDPFRDVDLTTKHEGSASGVVNGSDNESQTRENLRSGNVDENTNEINIKSGNSERNKQENNTNNVNETTDENFTKTGSNVGEEIIDEHSENAHTGDVSDNVNRAHNIITNTSEDGKSVESRTGSKNENYNENSNQNNVNSSSGNSESKNEDLQWDLFSDTPQGGIDGLNIPNAHAPSASLENNLYLTTARKVTNEGKNEDSNSNVSVQNNVGNQTSNTAQTENSNGNVTTETSKDGIESGNAQESAVKTYNEGNEGSKTGNKNTSNNFNEINTGNVDKTRDENGVVQTNDNENYNESNNNAINKGVKESNTENENINRGKTETRVSNNTDEYLQNIIGKSGGMSYSTMLMEFRQSFVNIDEMIIEELSDLFFGLW